MTRLEFKTNVIDGARLLAVFQEHYIGRLQVILGFIYTGLQ